MLHCVIPPRRSRTPPSRTAIPSIWPASSTMTGRGPEADAARSVTPSRIGIGSAVRSCDGTVADNVRHQCPSLRLLLFGHLLPVLALSPLLLPFALVLGDLLCHDDVDDSHCLPPARCAARSPLAEACVAPVPVLVRTVNGMGLGPGPAPAWGPPGQDRGPARRRDPGRMDAGRRLDLPRHPARGVSPRPVPIARGALPLAFTDRGFYAGSPPRTAPTRASIFAVSPSSFLTNANSPTTSTPRSASAARSTEKDSPGL